MNGGKRASAVAQRLSWIEVGRGLAALSVVFVHYRADRFPTGATPSFFALQNLGAHAVEFFFVLSGFIIFHVHGHELGAPHAVKRYAWRRLSRVLPIYWLVMTGALLFNQTFQNPAYRASIDLVYLARQILLLPGDFLLIGPAWTLRHELLFYLMFGLAILHRWIGLTIFATWMAAAMAMLALRGLPDGQVTDAAGIFLHHYNIDFLIGAAIAWCAQRSRIPLAAAVLVALAAIVLVAGSAIGIDPGVARAVISKLVFGFTLCACVGLSRGGVRAPGALILLGGMSYALYISHETIGVMFRGGLKRAGLAKWSESDLTLALGIGIALLCGYVLHRMFERPLLRRLYAVSWAQPRKIPVAAISSVPEAEPSNGSAIDPRP